MKGKHNLPHEEFDKLKEIKTFELYLKTDFNIDNISSLISPLFVLNDLRNLHGHLYQ